jgi:hypothetical protein
MARRNGSGPRVAPGSDRDADGQSPGRRRLFFALGSLPVPLILLPPDPSSWRALPPFPPNTPIVIGPSRFNLDRPARDASLDVITLPPGRDEPRLMGAPPPILALPGVVAFTSGSTGVPKPVYRSREGLPSTCWS